MPHYDFIEIGTSNFRTLIQDNATDTTKGISVEPISHYLDQLPERENVIKENVAISLDNTKGQATIYYIPEEVIEEKKLPRWMKGCNSLHEYHPNHLSRKKLTKLVSKQVVDQIPISELFEKHNVTSLDLLKIDTEGGDCDILLHFYDYIKNKEKSSYPKKIIFETNSLANKRKLKEVFKVYKTLNYFIQKKTKEDTTLILVDKDVTI